MLKLYQPFWNKLKQLGFPVNVVDVLKQETFNKLNEPVQGDYPRWSEAFFALPEITNIYCKKNTDAITCTADNVDEDLLQNCYKGLMPWRKGPFDMFGVHIDSEWQSFMKWNRIQKSIPDLKNKLVLDVGCGNGYYMLRMQEKNPLLLLGIDPGLLQLMQFWSIEKYCKSGAAVLPLALEQLPQNINAFDVVFSMGVLYHRKSPINHILELAQTLKKGGSLVLETLVVDGDEMSCLLPTGRYAQMRNVWFLPSVVMLSTMLQRNGFTNIQCIDITETSTQEQRSTQWMQFHSLEQFLSDDLTQTKEGYALPKRATLTATKR